MHTLAPVLPSAKLSVSWSRRMSVTMSPIRFHVGGAANPNVELDGT